MKLGMKKFVRDPRTLKLSAVMAGTLPPVPDAFDYETANPDIPLPMFGNDRLGDCVMAGRAHLTLAFEKREQGIVLPISESDVTAEYFKETGGADDGLDPMASLNAWRTGWTAAGKIYQIDAFGEIDLADTANIKAATYLLGGIGLALELPRSWQNAAVWDTFADAKGGWGGHWVSARSFTRKGVVCITWGCKKLITWAGLAQAGDACFGIVDSLDSGAVNDTLDVPALRAYLADVTA